MSVAEQPIVPFPHLLALLSRVGSTVAEGVGLLKSFGEVRRGGATPPGAVDPQPTLCPAAPSTHAGALDGSNLSSAPLALSSGRPSAGGAEGSAGGAGPSASRAGSPDPLPAPSAGRHSEKNTATESKSVAAHGTGASVPSGR